MAGNESKLWNKWSQSKNFKRYFPKAVRIEDRGEVTVPDVVAVMNRKNDFTNFEPDTIVVELKYAEPRKDGTFKIKWQKGQPAFLSSWVKAGGKAVVLLQVKQEALVIIWPQSSVNWIDWVQRPDLNLTMIQEMPLNAAVVQGLNFAAVNEIIPQYYLS